MDPFTLLVVAALLFVAYALGPKPPQPEPGSLDDVGVATAEEGDSVGVVYGKPWVKKHNWTWYGDLRSKAIKSKGGKK